MTTRDSSIGSHCQHRLSDQVSANTDESTARRTAQESPGPSAAEAADLRAAEYFRAAHFIVAVRADAWDTPAMKQYGAQASLPRPSAEPADTATTIYEIVSWLSGSQSYELDEADLVAALGARLRAAGRGISAYPRVSRTLGNRAASPAIDNKTRRVAPG